MSLLWCSSGRVAGSVSSEWGMWLMARSFQGVGLLACHFKSPSLHSTSEERNSRMLKNRPWIQVKSFKATAKIKSGYLFLIDFSPVTL